MSIIKPRANRVRTVRHMARLHEPNRDVLVQYARFIEDTPNYVLNQLIDTTLAKDRDFIAWRAEHPASPATEHPRRGAASRADDRV